MISPTDKMNKKFIAVGICAILVVAGVGVGLSMMNSSKERDLDIVSNGASMKIFGNADGNHVLDENDVKA